MENFKYLDIDALKYNLSCYSSKNICLMVKANAYGHGIEEIVKFSSKYVEAFGVVNIKEALKVRAFTKKRIIIFAPVVDFKLCREFNIEFMIENEDDLRKAIKNDCSHLLHLAINTGMNRFGTKSEIVLKSINNILNTNNIMLNSIYTHFSDTEDSHRTKKQYNKFCALRNLIKQNAPICFGGSGIYGYNFNFDMLRLGIGAYGYEPNKLKVMTVSSHIIKKFYAKKGEYIGYGKKYQVQKNGFFGVVQIGYGDGLTRTLSQKFTVSINGKKYKSVGNICMDAFFVKIDESVNVGDEVIVLRDASYLAKKAKTITYEILTNFSNLRGTVKKITSNKK